MKYIYISSKSGSVILDTSKAPTTAQIQSLVGRPNQTAQIEILYRQFSHSDLILIREQKGELKSMPIVARTIKGEKIFGDSLVLRNIPYSEGYKLGGLTHSQILIVQDELQLVKQPKPIKTANRKGRP
jgi:hypothetical protein